MVKELLQQAVAAVRPLAQWDDEAKNRFLRSAADKILSGKEKILLANQKDLQRMHPSDPKYDRLKLTEERIEEMTWGMQRVSSLETPLGKVLDKWRRPNGMLIQKVSVPIGVIGIIYEARPNVTTDVFSLCFKSGNVCVLKGGSDAAYSNQALVDIIRDTLEQHGITPDVCTLLPSDRRLRRNCCKPSGWSTSSFRAAAKP